MIDALIENCREFYQSPLAVLIMALIMGVLGWILAASILSYAFAVVEGAC